MHTTKHRTQDPQIVRGNAVNRYFLKVPVNGSAKSRLKPLRVFSYHINLKKYTTNVQAKHMFLYDYSTQRCKVSYKI